MCQSKEYRAQNEQLHTVNASLGSEVDKLQKELQQVRSQLKGGGQLNSLQEEVERLRAELQEAHAQRKRMEEEHRTEKLGLSQVSPEEPVTSERHRYTLTAVCVCVRACVCLCVRLCVCVQRVEQLETENSLLKSDKEEMNRRILQHSKSSEGAADTHLPEAAAVTQA